MAFIRLDELLTVNTLHIVKVKWKVSSDFDELSASVFIAGAEKNDVVSVRGETAYKLWGLLHSGEEIPRSPNRPQNSGTTLPMVTSRRYRPK